MIELYVNGITPAALAVIIALREKGLAYSLKEVDWQDTPEAMAAFSASLELGSNLEGEFPFLRVDAAAICDTFFILEYLDDRFPEPRLKPASAYGQWQVQNWGRFLGERSVPALTTLGLNDYFPSGALSSEVRLAFDKAETMSRERREAWLAAIDSKPDDALIQASRRNVELLLDRAESELAASAGDWLLGDSFSIADIAAFVLIHPIARGLISGFSFERRPAVERWVAAVTGRPAISSALAEHTLMFLPGPEHARWG